MCVMCDICTKYMYESPNYQKQNEFNYNNVMYDIYELFHELYNVQDLLNEFLLLEIN